MVAPTSAFATGESGEGLTAGATEAGSGSGATDEKTEAEKAAEAAAAKKAEEARKAAEEKKARIAKMAVVKDGLYNLRVVPQSSASLAVKDGSTKAGAKVTPAQRNLSDWAQKWIVLQDKNTGYYTIRNLGSRLYLTVSGSVKKGAKVKQAKTSASLAQKWELVNSSGSIVFKSAKNPKLALAFGTDKNGNYTATLKKYTGKKAQLLKLRKVEPIEDGHSYFVRSASASKKALAVKDASTKKNAKIVLDKRSSSSKAQKFRMEKTGSSWRMQCVQSCLYASASKSAIKQVKSSKGKARKWKLALNLNTATFTIKSASTGKFVDAKSGKLALRAKSTTKSKLPAKEQRFVLVPTYSFTVFLDAGHGRNASGWGVYDPGAEGNGRDEADLTKDLVERIAANLEGSDVRVFSGVEYSVPFWQRNAKARSLKCDVVLSVHFDADGGTSTSTMIGSGASTASRTFNSIIHPRLVSSTGLSDGGTSHRGDITVVNGRVPSVLMEVAFIDNYYSLHKYLGRRDTVAASIAEGIIVASKTPELQR